MRRIAPEEKTMVGKWPPPEPSEFKNDKTPISIKTTLRTASTSDACSRRSRYAAISFHEFDIPAA
jgi:hypothetical protein